jgi:hypothetical protein
VAILALCALLWILPYQLKSRGQFDSAVLARHYGTWFFHGTVLARMEGAGNALVAFMPWAIFLLAAPWWWRRAPDDGRRRVVLWTFTLWVLLAFSGKPRAHYMVPLYPLFALLTAELLTRGGAPEGRRLLRIAADASLLFAVAVAVVLIAWPTLLASGDDVAFIPEAWWERGLAAVTVLAGGAVAYRLARRQAWAAMTVTTALTLAAILVLVGFEYPARYARNHDVRPLAAAAAAHLAPGGAVVAYPDLPLSYDIYLRRPVVEVVAVNRMADLLASSTPGQVVISSRRRWQGLLSRTSSSWRVLATRTVNGREMVVAGSPLARRDQAAGLTSGPRHLVLLPPAPATPSPGTRPRRRGSGTCAKGSSVTCSPAILRQRLRLTTSRRG